MVFSLQGFVFFCCDPTRVVVSSFLRFLDHTQWRTTVGRSPLDEGSARRRDLYLTTHNTLNRQTSMPPVGFEPTISADERPQTYALDHAATGTGIFFTTMDWKYFHRNESPFIIGLSTNTSFITLNLWMFIYKNASLLDTRDVLYNIYQKITNTSDDEFLT